MIKLEGLSKTYARVGAKAVDRLSLDVRDGEIFGFLGPNGAGKTTTIKMLTGVLKPDEGRVSLDGIDMAADAIAAKRRFGYVSDNPELFGKLKAHEYLNFVADVYGVPDRERQARIEEIAGRFEIADALAASIGSFSRGMKQKLCVTASLLHDPANWILDEPMVGLDPQAAFDLKELMRARAAAGGAVFFSTHVMEVAEKLCDRIAVIARGRLLFVGSLEELRARQAGASGEAGEDSLERLFLDLVDDEPAAEAAR
ncbi:MAG: ABC transporter ATP-binding protein [Spirochaetaceae bacterium]|nr:ABC transporter ATP-binding protein [Spirochaetaceae bacterium]